MFAPEDEMDEIVGHAYLFLREQLEIPAVSAPSAILHGTIIGAHQSFILLPIYCFYPKGGLWVFHLVLDLALPSRPVLSWSF